MLTTTLRKDRLHMPCTSFKKGDKQNTRAKKKIERKICSECGVAMGWGHKVFWMGFGVWIDCNDWTMKHFLLTHRWYVTCRLFTRITAACIYSGHAASCMLLGWKAFTTSDSYPQTQRALQASGIASFSDDVCLHQVRTYLCWWKTANYYYTYNNLNEDAYVRCMHACAHATAQFTNECIQSTHTHFVGHSVKSKVTKSVFVCDQRCPTSELRVELWWHSTEMMFSFWRIIPCTDKDTTSTKRWETEIALIYWTYFMGTSAHVNCAKCTWMCIV